MPYLLHFDSPYAFDPGGLTIDEVSEQITSTQKNETYAQVSVRQSQMAWKYKTFQVENWNQPSL